MKKKELLSCLCKVFFNDWGSDELTCLKALSALLAYYCTNDISKELCENINNLHILLLKADFYDQSLIKKEIPTDFHCSLDSLKPVPAFNFSPQISVSFSNTELDSGFNIASELSTINIVGLIQYVREKAIAAGDLIFEE